MEVGEHHCEVEVDEQHCICGSTVGMEQRDFHKYIKLSYNILIL